MPIRTLCLSLLVLASTAFPAQAFRLTYARPQPRRIRPDLGFALAILAVAGLAIAVSPVRELFGLPAEPRWFLYALGAGLLAPFAEYLVGLIALRRLAPLRVHDLAGQGPLAVLAVLVAAIAEEMVFRGVFTPVLATLVPMWLAAGVAAIVYGLNHLYFGWLAVWQKTLTGVGFGILFVLSGFSVLVPMAAHAVQNLVVLALPRRSR